MIDQKYKCSKCDPTWVRVDDHYECNRKCGKKGVKTPSSGFLNDGLYYYE